MNKEVLKQAVAGGIGAILAAIIFTLGSFLFEGKLVESIGGLTEAKLEKSKTIDGINHQLGLLENIITPSDRIISRKVLKVKGEAPWGIWHEATYCPNNYYVCGLQQKVEPKQGGGSNDDTALNGVALKCCKFILPMESSK